MLGNRTYIGLYGNDARLFDTAGPFATFDRAPAPNTVKGVAVDPAFVEAVQQQRTVNYVVYAHLQQEPGEYNDLMNSSGFHTLRIVSFVMVSALLAFSDGA